MRSSEYPIKWHIQTVQVSESEATLLILAIMEKGWYIFSKDSKIEGPVPTTIDIGVSKEFSLLGSLRQESKLEKIINDSLQSEFLCLPGPAIFTQRLILHEPSMIVKGHIKFMATNGSICLSPEDMSFHLSIPKIIS